LDYQNINIRTVIEKIAHSLRPSIEQKGLTFLLDLPANLPKAVLLDETRLRQIISNLLSNACKFTQQGGIHLTVQASTHDTQVNLSISIADTGIGIAQQDQRRIFHAFEQSTQTEQDNANGSGLGFTIVHQLVQLLDGQITLQSQPERGSVFTLVLPKLDIPVFSDRADTDVDDPMNFKFSPAHILIADDLALNRLFLRLWVEEVGLSCTEVADGNALLAQVELQQPDLILTDLKMPECTGQQAAQQLISNPATAHIPIILITAATINLDLSSYQGLFNACLFKPLQRQTLLKTLANCLDWPID